MIANLNCDTLKGTVENNNRICGILAANPVIGWRFILNKYNESHKRIPKKMTSLPGFAPQLRSIVSKEKATEEVRQVMHIISSTLIYRPIKRVFDFISTPENDFQWQYGTLASTRLSEGIIGLGTCFQSVSHFMEYRIQSTFEVTEYEPNLKYEFKSTSGPLQSLTTYTFETTKNCTQVTVSMQANAINLIGLNENVLEKKMKRQLKDNLAMLKNILESG